MLGLNHRDSFIDKCLKILIFFSILFIPLVYSASHLYFFATPKYVLLAWAGSLCFALLAFRFINFKFYLNQKLQIALALAAAFVLWLFITSLLGIDANTSLWSNFGRHTGFWTYLFCLLFFAASLFVYNKESLFSPLKAVVLGGALASLSVYLGPALLNLDFSILKFSAAGGTFGNSTYAALFLIFSLFSALILYFTEEARKPKILWSICFLFILLSPIFINFKNNFIGEARVGMVSLIIGGLISIFFYLAYSSNKVVSNFSKTILLLALVVFIYGTLNLVRPEGTLNNYFSNTKEGVRFFYWDMASRGISERPWLGFGLENFPSVHNQYFDPILLSPQYPSESWADKPHNNMLELAFSSGIPGLMLYLLFIAYLLLSLIKKISSSAEKDKIIASLFLGLIIAYNFQLFFAFDTVPSLLVFFVTAAAISVFCYRNGDEETPAKLRFKGKSIITLLFLLAAAAMIYFLAINVGKESKVIRQLNSLPIPNRVSSFENTMKISPTGTLLTEAQYIDITISRYKSAWNTLDSQVKEGGKKELEFLLEYSKKRSDQYPKDLRFALVAAKIANILYEINTPKQPELLKMAKKYGMRTVFNSPEGEKGYQVLIATYLLEGRVSQALKFAEILSSLNLKVPEFHNLVIYISKLKKDQRLVDEKIKNASKFIPNYEYGMER